jgi:hypothetical protein
MDLSCKLLVASPLPCLRWSGVEAVAGDPHLSSCAAAAREAPPPRSPARASIATLLANSGNSSPSFEVMYQDRKDHAAGMLRSAVSADFILWRYRWSRLQGVGYRFD